MASYHQIRRNVVHPHPVEESSTASLADVYESSTSLQSAVLLFPHHHHEPDRSIVAISSSSAPPSEHDNNSDDEDRDEDGEHVLQQSRWSFIDRKSATRRRPSPAASSLTTDSSSRDPTMTTDTRTALDQSLFPSHQGDGIFIAGSLVETATVTTTASTSSNGARSDEGDLFNGSTALSDDLESVNSSSARTTSSSSWFQAAANPTSADSADEHPAQAMSARSRTRRVARSLHRGARSMVGSHHVVHGSGSRALTEEALSTIPDADPGLLHGIAHATGPGSAGFTSSSSEGSASDDVVEAGRHRQSSNTPKQGRKIRAQNERRRGHGGGIDSADNDETGAEADEDDEVLSTTPQARNKGLLARWAAAATTSGPRAPAATSAWTREAYPSPPPEDMMTDDGNDESKLRRIKRRHRQSGRGPGSQKRSSTSGSLAGGQGQGRTVLAPSLAAMARQLQAEIESMRRHETPQQMEERIRREHAERDILLGGVVGARVLGVDTETMQLVAKEFQQRTPEATPTPSRATSPVQGVSRSHATPQNPNRSRFDRRRKGQPSTGALALAQHARDELGDSSMFYFDDDEAATQSSVREDDSGDETETEATATTTTTTTWHHTTSPLVFAPRRQQQQQQQQLQSRQDDQDASSSMNPALAIHPRSFSATSLPAYLSRASRQHYEDELGFELSQRQHHQQQRDAEAKLRRTTSYESSSAGGLGVGSGAGGGSGPDNESAWGGEFEGFEAAMSYWRKLLRRLRGHRSGIGAE